MDSKLQSLIARLGFSSETTKNHFLISRLNFVFKLELDQPWRSYAWAIWAARLAVDQLSSNYDPSSEGSQSNIPRNIYEVPSPYGDRERLLLPTVVANLLETFISKKLVRSDWIDPHWTIVYSLQEGLGVHLLTLPHLDNFPFPKQKMVERARLAHFYASYKMKVIKKVTIKNRAISKVYGSSDGRTGSRALLFPDFDWDAAQDFGVLFLPSRDSLIVAEPLQPEFADIAAYLSYRVLANAVGQASMPPFARIEQLSSSDIDAVDAAVRDLSFSQRELDWFHHIPFSLDHYLLSPDGISPPKFDFPSSLPIRQI